MGMSAAKPFDSGTLPQVVISDRGVFGMFNFFEHVLHFVWSYHDSGLNVQDHIYSMIQNMKGMRQTIVLNSVFVFTQYLLTILQSNQDAKNRAYISKN